MDLYPEVTEWRRKLLKAAREHSLQNLPCILEDVTNDYSINVLDMAIERDDWYILKLVIDTLLEAQIKREDITELLMQTYCPLYLFVHHEMDLEIFEKMTKICPDLNEVDECDRSALFYAIEQGLDEAVAILVRSGADIDLSEYEWRRQIHITSLPVLKSLVTNGVDVNGVDEEGQTLLKIIMLLRDEIYYDELLSYDCNTEEFILCLLENGAHLNLGRKCRHVEKHGSPDRQLTDAVDHLIDCEMTSDERYIYWHRAIEHGWLRLIKSFLKREIDINRRDEVGFTPLHNLMSYWNQTRLVSPIEKHERLEIVLRLSLDHGADVNAKVSADGWMHYEARHRCPRGKRCDGECTILHLATWEQGLGLETKSIEQTRMMQKPIIENIARLVHLRKSVNSSDLQIIEECDYLKNYFESCMQELESMQARTFHKNITLSDVLNDDIVQQLSKLQTIHSIESSVADEYRNEFPIFSKTLIYKIKKIAILQCKRLLKQGSITLNDLYDSALSTALNESIIM